MLKKTHVARSSDSIEQAKLQELFFVYKLIGIAIIIYFITNCIIGFAFGLLLTICIKMMCDENAQQKINNLLIAICSITIPTAIIISFHRTLHPFNSVYGTRTDWLMIIRQIILAPGLSLGVSLLTAKPIPLAQRLHGWDRLPNDPKPSIVGRHVDGKAIVGHRIENGKKLPVYVPFIPGKHGLVVAKTGSGKSAFISNIIESCCEYTDGLDQKRFVVVIDGKADRTEYSLYSLMEREARRTGRRLHVIDIANPEEQIDIFAGMDSVAIKDALMGMSEWTEPHYKASSAQFYSLLAEVLLIAENEAVTFKTLEMYCQKSKITNLVNRLHREGIINDVKHAEYLSTIEVTSDIARAAAPRFAVMTQGIGERLFPSTKDDCEKALSITEAYEKDEMVLVMINSMAYSEYAFASGALVISAVKQLVSKSQIGELEQKGILCVCDELSQYASETITQLYSQGRVAGLQIWGIVQSLTDFDKRQNGESIRNTITGNSSYIVNFSVTLPKDAEDLADIYSTEQAPEVTTQVAGSDASGMGSAKLVDRYIVHPRTIKALPNLVGYIKYAGDDEPGPYRFTCRLVDFEK